MQNLKLSIELRGVGEHGTPKVKTLATNLPAGTFHHWTDLTLGGDEFKDFGSVVAWRATLVERRPTARRTKILPLVNPAPIPVKIYCACGQKYSFEVWPHDGRMPAPVSCPVCHRDGTAEADRVLYRALNGKTQPLPPPSINSLLTHVQASLAPHLVEALKDAVVQELAAQRRELLSAQQAATAELTELAHRLESVQTPLLERLRAYEQRISELEKELGEQSKENRELLKLKIDLIREQIETERRSQPAQVQLRFCLEVKYL